MKHFGKKTRAWAGELERAGEAFAWSAARRGAELAKEFVPVDSGALRASIMTVRSGNGAAVIAAAPYAAMVEFGTRRSGAQPYMQPMAQMMQGELKELARDALREVMV